MLRSDLFSKYWPRYSQVGPSLVLFVEDAAADGDAVEDGATVEEVAEVEDVDEVVEDIVGLPDVDVEPVDMVVLCVVVTLDVLCVFAIVLLVVVLERATISMSAHA